MEVKQSVAVRVPVRLVDVTNTPVTGAVFGSATVYLIKQGGGVAVKVLIAGELPELGSGTVPGHYDLSLAAADVDTLGFLRYQVAYSGAVTYNGLVEVVARLEGETYTAVSALPAGATQAQVIAAVALLALEATVTPLAAAIAAIPTNPALDTDYTAARAVKLDNLDAAVSTAGGGARRVP